MLKAKKKVRPVKKVVVSKRRVKVQKPIGVVTHFFDKIKVAIFKFKKPVKIGATLSIRGAHTDLTITVKSMQQDHEAIKTAPKNKEVGIKVPKLVRKGDEVFAE